MEHTTIAPSDHGQHAHRSQTGHDHADRHAVGHDKHAGHDPELFRRRFWLTLAMTVPVVLTSEMVMDWFGYRIDGVTWVGPLLGTAIYLWGGQPFLVSALAEIRSRAPGMMLLIAMAITVAWGASMASTIGWLDLEFWWELAALVTIMLLGHWQEMKAIGQARGALAALAELLPDEAEVVTADGVRHVAISDLRVGERLLVRPGGRVAADGLIVEGSAELDESMITGESRPVSRTIGDRVVAGTVSTDSALHVQITAVGDDTAVAGIQRLVADAQASRSRAQVLADRFAAVLFYVAVASAVTALLVWGAFGQWDTGLVAAVTVLVIACPHALGLAIPLVVSISTALASRSGILVRDRLALERMRSVDTVLFDKTGTLTLGQHRLTGIATVTGRSDDDVLGLAAALERDSEHPLARAIVSAAEGHEIPRAESFTAITGRGVEAVVDGQRYAIGGPALLRERDLRLPEELTGTVSEWQDRGASVLHLIDAKGVIASFALEDAVRPESVEAVAELHRLGVANVVMITGDARSVADHVGRRIGIDEVHAEVLPEDKDRTVTALRDAGHRVAMVGDGVNDAPALARADVGLAIGAGTDVAIESAGMVLAGSDPRAVGSVIRLSRASYRKMWQNLAWAAGYNVLAIPVAAGAFVWAGITMPPALAAILMSLSTVVVAINAQLLRRVQLTPGSGQPT
jgi:Cu2+-exporting ATPase